MTGKHPVTPGPPLPARELLGDMLLEIGRPAEALAAYEASLREAPNRFNSLYGAARAAELSQDMHAHVNSTSRSSRSASRIRHGPSWRGRGNSRAESGHRSPPAAAVRDGAS